MAIWTVKTYHKKSCEQREIYRRRDGSGEIKVIDGFRWCEYTVETDDDEFPQFEFTEVPGGDGKCDSLDLNCVSGNNIIGSELQMLDDGGCWGDVEINDVDDEEETERLMEFIEENGAFALEDDGDWYIDDTEVWVWGPLEVTSEDGTITRIIMADEEGNMIDFEEE